MEEPTLRVRGRLRIPLPRRPRRPRPLLAFAAALVLVVALAVIAVGWHRSRQRLHGVVEDRMRSIRSQLEQEASP